jgi:hypothetical protein
MNLWLFNHFWDEDMLWKLLCRWLLWLRVAVVIEVLTIIFSSLLVFFICSEE